MDIKELKQIADIMKRAGLTEVEIEEKDVRLRVCRKAEEAGGGHALVAPMSAAPFPPPPDSASGGSAGAPDKAEEPAPEANLATITSPMVGTFYRSPSPESEPFVEVGSPLEEDSVVCIIEAMKVMNEIQAEMRGKVVEVLVENGQSVEFGQPLIRVKQA